MAVPRFPTAPVMCRAAGGGDSEAAPDSATEGPAWELPWEPLDPQVRVSSGAGLSHGCSLSTVDPSRGRGLLVGAQSCHHSGACQHWFVGGRVLVCALWGLKNSSFGFRRRRQLTLGSSPLSSFCCFLHTTWDRSLIPCSLFLLLVLITYYLFLLFGAILALSSFLY